MDIDGPFGPCELGTLWVHVNALVSIKGPSGPVQCAPFGCILGFLFWALRAQYSEYTLRLNKQTVMLDEFFISLSKETLLSHRCTYNVDLLSYICNCGKR